jgi:hypothetical protein
VKYREEEPGSNEENVEHRKRGMRIKKYYF